MKTQTQKIIEHLLLALDTNYPVVHCYESYFKIFQGEHSKSNLERDDYNVDVVPQGGRDEAICYGGNCFTVFSDKLFNRCIEYSNISDEPSLQNAIMSMFSYSGTASYKERD